MSAEVLREFLVSLSYKVDKSTESNFRRSVLDATDALKRFGQILAGTAIAAGAAVAATANHLEGLYYASRRTGASVQSHQAFSYAVAQMGGSSEEARSSVENLARAMRDNPGMRGFVRDIVGPGVNTDDAVETMNALGAAFRRMPYELARLRAGMLGIDERTFQAMLQDTGRLEERYRQMAKRMGVDSEAAARAARGLGNDLRDLRAVGDLTMTGIMTALAPVMPRLQEAAENFGIWLIQTTPKVLKFVDETVGLENAFKALAAVVALTLLSPLIRLVGVLGSLVRAMTTLSALSLPAWLLPLLGAAGVGALGSGVGDIQREAEQQGRRLSTPEAVREWLRRHGMQFEMDGPLPGTPIRPGEQQPSLGERAREWLRENGWRFREDGAAGGGQQLGSAAMDFFQQAGWTQAQAAGIVANLQHESGFRPGAVGDGGMSFGLAQWNRSRLDDLGRFLGGDRDPRSATFDEQLAFIQHELTQGKERAAGRLLAMMTDARSAGEVVSRYYERPRQTAAEAFARGRTAEEWFARRPLMAERTGSAGPVTIQQTNTTTITASSTDPAAIGREVGREQGRENANLIRTLRGGVQ